MCGNLKRFLVLALFLLLTISCVYASDNSTDSIMEKEDCSISDNNIQDNGNNLSDVETYKEKNIKTSSSNIVYVNSKGNASSNGLLKSNPTTLTNALNLYKNNTVFYLTTNKASDDYSNITINLNKIRNIYNINFTGDNSKKIYFNSFIMYETQNITISNLFFSNNKYVINYGNLTVNNCTFVNNTNRDTRISCILYNSGGNVVINNSHFMNNFGNLSGAVYSNYADSLKVINTTFSDNSAFVGGAITVRDTNTSLINCSFINNSARVGGALSVLGYNTSFDMTGCVLKNNTASGYGGALYAMYSNSTIINNTFSNNSAGNFSGALAVVASDYTNISSNVIIDNYASNYSIMYFLRSNVSAEYNVIYNSKINSWFGVDDCDKFSLNNNWWSNNTPLFEVISNGFIPDSWIYFKLSNSSNTLNVTAYILNGTKSAKIPQRTAVFNASNATFKKNYYAYYKQHNK